MAEPDVVIVGGAGHVGLPLGLTFAEEGLGVALYDLDEVAVATINRGVMPFEETGAQSLLDKTVGRQLCATTDPSTIAAATYVVVVIGTPVDEYLNPQPEVISVAVEEIAPYLRQGQCVVLRSTLFPGTTRAVERTLGRLGIDVDVAFCPERIAEGQALVELRALPQIVSARTDTGFERAASLFQRITAQIVRLEPEEAEFAKLFTNTWRYIKFATANQLYMIANDFGLDYEKIRTALAFEYPRASDLPRAGFAAGPCLLKDTMQLAAFNDNNFVLGHAAMLVNEGLPLYVVSRIEEKYPLEEMTVGILGMAFKEESDDIRSSLSYKLKRILRFKAERVICNDPYVTVDAELLPLDEVVAAADLLIVGAPHACYADLDVPVPIVDIWGMGSRGVQL